MNPSRVLVSLCQTEETRETPVTSDSYLGELETCYFLRKPWFLTKFV